MAAPLQIHQVPDRIRTQYNTRQQGPETTHMAKEVPRQYQRNSEDLQRLKFPSTKTILWDHASIGEPFTLHPSWYRKPRLCIEEKVLQFAQRHVESTGQNSCSSVLVGSVTVTDDGEGIVFNVERLDPLGNPNMSSSHAAGDMLIHFTIQRTNKERGSSMDDYSNALQVLKQRCCSSEPIELANFLVTKGWCSIYPGSADKCVHHLEFDVVTMATEITATPIEPVPIRPSGLSKNLSGPNSLSLTQGVPKTGYLSMNHTRELLLVLDGDKESVAVKPMIGIWVSGVCHVYSPYVWACCLRYLHNSSIQDRVCSPPEPFLLVLYNPTHTKPEFYECSTACGTSKLQFDLYSGYEAVQINKTRGSSGGDVEFDLDAIQTGRKKDIFDEAVQKFSVSPSLDESRRSLSPEQTRHDEITPRGFKPAPYQSKATLTQSRVPEVTMLFEDDDTFVPNVKHPKDPPRRTLSEPHQSRVPDSRAKSTGHLSTVNPRSLQGGTSTCNSDRNNEIQNLHQQMRTAYSGTNTNQLPISSSRATAHSTSGAYQKRQSQAVTLSTQNSPDTMHAPGALPSQIAQSPMPHSPIVPTSQQAPIPHLHHPPSQSHPRMAQHGSQQGYPVFPGAPASHGSRPGFCMCPNCPRPPPFTGRPQPYDLQRGPAPRPTYSNYGPPPPRLSGPYHGHPPNSHLGYSYPPSSGHQPYPPVNNESTPTNLKPHPNMNVQASGVNVHPQYGYQQQQLTSPSNIERAESPAHPAVHSQQPRTSSSQQLQPMNRMMSPPLPQSSGGVPALSKERTLSSGAQVQFPEGPTPAPVYRAVDVRQSNPGSDNSTRSSDDSGLSFTPEKHNSPSNPSPKTMPLTLRPVAEPSSMGQLSVANVDRNSVTPEVYQLLMTQAQELKQMRAQIALLTAQMSMNTTAESQQAALNTSPQQAIMSREEQTVPKHTIATNTSDGLIRNIEQVSACMQTSPQKRSCTTSRQNSHESSRSSQPVLNRSFSHSTASSGSGCETRTPVGIRHRGHQPLNSTHRHSPSDLDMSQGEIVALMNNMQNNTYESEQSEIVMDLSGFQSSFTGFMQSEESYEGETTVNSSQRSPRPAGVDDQCVFDDDEEESDFSDEDDDADEVHHDTPKKCYNKVTDNIRRILLDVQQNATAGEATNGYHGDVSSDLSMQPDLANEDFQMGIQSYIQYDDSSNNAALPTDMTYMPRIDYNSVIMDSSDPETSTMNGMIDGLAMKYLPDTQLTQCAKLQDRNRLLQGPKQTAYKNNVLQKILRAENDYTPNVTKMGMSPNNLTFATKQYMEKNGLIEGGTVSCESSPESESSFQLKTNNSRNSRRETNVDDRILDITSLRDLPKLS